MQNNSLSEDGQSLLTLAFILWQNEKHVKALAVLEGLQYLEPDSPDYLPLLCAVYLDNELYKEALDIGYNLLKTTTGDDHMSVATLCATSLWKSNRQAEAKQLLQEAVENINAVHKQ